MIIYHGSDKIVTKPLFGYGKRTNDYGSGFYTTENLEIAKEWGCQENENGFVNMYEIDLDGLKILNLNSSKYNILNWLAILVKNRTFSSTSLMMKEAKQYLLDNFLIDTSNYDVIIGYRADDSYFSFARDFLSNTISLEKLKKAMKLGKLGTQVFIQSKKAFDKLTFIKYYNVDWKEYYSKKVKRDINARKKYLECKQSITKGIYILNIMKEEMKQNDPRLFM